MNDNLFARQFLVIYNKNKNSLEWHSLEKFFLGMAFLGKKIPWSVVQPFGITNHHFFAKGLKSLDFRPA
jgi:hypothetical protein